MIYPKIRIQYLPKHPPFDMDEEVKNNMTLQEVLPRFLLPSSGKLFFWISELLLTGCGGLLEQVNSFTFSYEPKANLTGLKRGLL